MSQNNQQAPDDNWEMKFEKKVLGIYKNLVNERVDVLGKVFRLLNLTDYP
jgi:hypothetical protein